MVLKVLFSAIAGGAEVAFVWGFARVDEVVYSNRAESLSGEFALIAAVHFSVFCADVFVAFAGVIALTDDAVKLAELVVLVQKTFAGGGVVDEAACMCLAS